MKSSVGYGEKIFKKDFSILSAETFKIKAKTTVSLNVEKMQFTIYGGIIVLLISKKTHKYKHNLFLA